MGRPRAPNKQGKVVAGMGRGVLRPMAALPSFRLDMRSYNLLLEVIRLQDKSVSRTLSSFVNTMAFEARRAVEKRIRDTMKVRVKSLLPFFSIKKSPKNPGSKSIVVATMSTIHVAGTGAPRTRFTGWIEQETGKSQRRERSHTMEARSNSYGSVIKPRNRINPKTNFLSLENSKWNSYSNNIKVARFLTDLRTIRYKKPFILPQNSYAKTVHGLYKFVGRQPANPRDGKMKLLINLSKAPKQPRRTKVVSRAVEKITSPAYVHKVFVQEFKKQLQIVGIKKYYRFK